MEYQCFHCIPSRVLCVLACLPACPLACLLACLLACACNCVSYIQNAVCVPDSLVSYRIVILVRQFTLVSFNFSLSSYRASHSCAAHITLENTQPLSVYSKWLYERLVLSPIYTPFARFDTHWHVDSCTSNHLPIDCSI